MSRAIRNGSIVATIVAIAVAGCGSSSKPPKPALTEPQQVEHVLRSYLSAQTSGDGQTACALLTDSAQRQLETVVLQAAKGLLPSRPSCQEAVAAVKAFAPADLLAALSKAQIGQVQVQGDHATAEISGGTVFGKEHVSLERSDGTWKITGVPGLHV